MDFLKIGYVQYSDQNDVWRMFFGCVGRWWENGKPGGYVIIDDGCLSLVRGVTNLGLHIVLYQPEIPANTGNIARTCAATGTRLHLIRPLGFSTDDKMLKRAGLDYWPFVDIHYHDHLDEFFAAYPNAEYYFVENYGETLYSSVDYSDRNKDYVFFFGRESSGLPKDLFERYRERHIYIPMTGVVRSLNLSNTAAIMVYEALRQQGFPKLNR